MKDIITTAVNAAIQQKDNENALDLTEIRTANERKLQKILQALATLRKIVDGLAIREGNKKDSGYNKSGGGGNNGGRGSGGGNHKTSDKNDNKENNVSSRIEKWIYTKGAECNTTWLYKKRQCFNKERNLADKN